MQYATLGRSNVSVSKICIGTMLCWLHCTSVRTEGKKSRRFENRNTLAGRKAFHTIDWLTLRQALF